MKAKNHFEDGIQDIVFKNNEVYLVKRNILSTAEIESQIANIKYNKEYPKVIDERVEKISLPPFALTFYRFILSQNHIPTPNQFFDFYLQKYFVVNPDNSVSLKSLTNKSFDPLAIKSRIYRTYPSLIRDIHFFYLCQESGIFDQVKYSLNFDYFEGLSIYLTYQDTNFYVKLIMKTPRSRSYDKIKFLRHNQYDIKEITLEIDPKECKKVGEFYLYDTKHIEQIKQSFLKK